ncbi:helix-turn-helix domain-containing protein [Anaerocolumna sp. AGMB13025]|uniref:helix-turn-helix domain-containing protein n=1 Tax=Anaerocolumna sp. AGMB13025 TaxID=3039116 RepID=UPI00241FCDB4|nr:helix-turn-helix domain-containing protein [Anaerocolumna sp. AGMB13025]WFR55048.1 helix-turn-helix domain-containing protein [Anaerocolumna sp. AGMB13025]
MQQYDYNKALLNLDEFCAYLGINKSKAREILDDSRNKFTVRIGNRLYAHKKKLDEWLEMQTEFR